MIVFTGYETGRYNACSDSWHFGSDSNQPDMIPRMSIWTGTEMIVWDGQNGAGIRRERASNRKPGGQAMALPVDKFG
jgi:hypothetical protein